MSNCSVFIDDLDPDAVRAPVLAGATMFRTASFFDIPLPELDGLELQKRVAVERTDTPIIFITATSRQKSRRAVEFLTKPVNEDVLLSAVRQALCSPKVRN